ncbi:hypothetical protein FGO68_gene1462 [Halteria grandinella]|uniref:Fungal lipase-type domain-containing protein n=1 Tax=Halteria grandinella TaxID=5974 RepID=A0A8J8SVI1_HALGN|nr:hypothetical protein FGO68_gene1462 [Halteria grandinella]
MTQYKGLNESLVHLGFYQTYQYVSSKVLSAVSTYLSESPSATILVTGHSLGAALATHAALDIKEAINPSNLSFYSFGSPRVGNAVFADYIMTQFPQGLYQRVTHYTDLAVHVPLREMNYKHAGNEVWYMNKGAEMEYAECANEAGQAENEGCANSNYWAQDPNSHLIYVGHLLPGMCKNTQPEGSANFLA